MTDNINVISRPKVRFCQFSDNTRNKTETVEDSGQQQSGLQTSGLKIKEIVTLKKPIRIVDPTKFGSICDKDTSSSNCNTGTLSHYCTTSGNVRNMSLSNKNTPKVKNIMILHDANGIQNTKNSSKMLQRQNKSSQDDVLKDNAKNVRQNGKENKDKLLNKSASNKNVSDTIGNFQHSVQLVAREKFKPSVDNIHIPKVNIQDFKSSKMTKPQYTSSNIKKTRNSMIEEKINAKSVLSHYKTMTKNKISPVKKIVSRNVSGPKIKTSVGSVFHKEQANPKTSDGNEQCIVALDVTTVQDLAQPEYNSIMCTVNKLKELERQKIVADINHLPFALKSCLNGKHAFIYYFEIIFSLQISAALDFPLDETLYKNLVDLSIDEKQLPSTITRSKDPEPRQKDIVPQLSDFFIPEDIKEICEAVHVKFRVSKIDDNWNAFKISNRILEWKYKSNSDGIDTELLP
ncbi:hypothetical protein ALC60_10866 [Trachymyrmex zeteki]|uniref:Uncharacterized protein n=1 Tax=Mycetomoellerius zeteki TaxID=64791 RepID=A0A151WQG9_9HYME|nr:hypothetical protein ALC60_10866 [Trachymyrmex zeteki]